MNAQFQLDDTFDGDGKLELAYFDYHEAIQMIVTSDSNMLMLGLAGRVTGNGFDYDFVLSKKDFDGNPITSFGTNGDLVGDFPGFDYSDMSSVIELSDGSFLLSGKGYAWSNSSVRPVMLMHVLSDGTIDNSFNTSGVLQVDFLGDINLPGRLHLADDDKILFAASSEDTVDNSGYVAVLARFNDDYSLDTTFGGTGKIEVDVSAGAAPINAKVQHVSSGGFADISTDADGNVYAVGYTLNSDRYGFMVKLKENGELDSAFYDEGMHAYLPATTVKTNSARQIDRLKDSSFVLIFHTDLTANDFVVGHIKDNTFASYQFDIDGNQDFLEDVLEDESGRLYLVGRTIDNSGFNSASYADRYSVIRLNSDFSQDMSFGSGGVLSFTWGTGEQAGANVAILAQDNEIILGGEVYGPSVSYINLGLVKLVDNTLTNVVPNFVLDEFKIFPNPTSGASYIEIDSENNINQVYLLSMTGKKWSFEGGRLEVDDIPSGVYLVMIHLEGRIYTSRLIKN